MFAVSDFTTELEDIQYSPGYVNELEQKIKSLEIDNAALFRYKRECERLDIELKHVMTLKDTYEEKYNEASMKLICIDDDDDDSLLFGENEQIKTLNEKILILLHANEDLRKEIEFKKKEVGEVRQESDKFKALYSDVQEKYLMLQNKETSDKETMTAPEIQMKIKRKSVSINENFIEVEPLTNIKPKSGEYDLNIEASAFSKYMKRKSVYTDTDSPDKPEDQEKSDPLEIFSKTFTSKIFITGPTCESLNSPTIATSNSPYARDMTSPKIKPKLALSRQSPKVRQPKKQKSAYVPSFMRKKSKVAKK